MTELQQDRGCAKCRYKKSIDCGGGFVIMGCTHAPYKGKWVAEIKECPRKDFEELCKKRWSFNKALRIINEMVGDSDGRE